MYSALDEVVSGKDVLVLGPSSCLTACAGADGGSENRIVIRFNRDAQPADILATAFFREVDVGPRPDLKLIVSTVPNAVMDYWNPTYDHSIGTQDFEKALARYVGDTPLGFFGDTPLECICPHHWRLLSLSMPLFPLSGIAMLSMLETTQMKSCEVHGLNFYTDISRRAFFRKCAYRFRPRKPFFLMHDYVAAIDWLQRLVESDRRFEWKEDLSLDEIRAEVAWRVKILSAYRFAATSANTFAKMFR